MTTTKKPAPDVPESPVRSIGSVVLAVLAIGVCVVAEVAIVASRHRFTRFIEEFELAVSLVTQFALGPVLPILLANVIVAAIVKELAPVSHLLRDRCNLFILVLGAGSIGTYVIGIFAPLVNLIDSLS